jgi:hypothetical protein
MDYYINDKNTLSVYTNQNKVNSDNNRREYHESDANDNIIQKSNYKSDNSDGTYNLAFKHLTKKKAKH